MRQARPDKAAPEWQIWAALLVVYIVWGSTYLAIRVVVGTMGRVRLTEMLTGNTERVRVASSSQRLANGRLDAARAMRQVVAAAANTSSDASPTPTPTPTPTPSPTPKPTPTPSPTPSDPPSTGSYTWKGTLSATDTWDRETFYIRRHVHVRVRWTGIDEMRFYVVHPNGTVFRREAGSTIDFEMDVQGGEFIFTVQEPRAADVTYTVTIEYGI